MGFDSNKAVRFKNEAELKPSPWGKKDDANKVNVFKPNSMPERELSGKFKVFSEDYETLRKKIFDPGHELIQSWNKVFLVSCLVALFLDPLYFYLPAVNKNGQCMNIDTPLGITVTVFRSFTDLFYILHVIVKFRTAYVAPSSRVFGRGELVVDPRKIAARYLKTDFILDFAAALPLPQIVIWFIIPALRSSSADHTKNALSLIVLFQYFPRLFLIFPLTAQIVRTTGVVTKTAWAGAAYNLLLYMLASHVLGACWYLLAMERQNQCWRKQCRMEKSCDLDFLDCRSLDDNLEDLRRAWENITNVWANCNATDTNIPYQFGIFSDALTTGIVSSLFLEKYFYCLWWGLRNLSSLGQNLQTSTYMGETSFAILIAIVGLVLFAHLIGNMQTYLQSLTIRLEEWRVKRRDTEEWMRHRQLPSDLRGRVRRYVQYQWVATRGVDEEALLRSLPTDLRRDIQRHLCLNLVRRVPFFSQLDDQLLDAICERLKSALSTEGTYIFREGDPVNEMLFIIRGCLDSTTTDGGRSGFFNSVTLGPGDFCGEELLTWALLPKSGLNLPSSTRNVKALVEVEAFALRAEDLKFVANQFRRLHSKRLQHTFRFYSQQWRAWAACFIQAAWRRHTRRQRAAELQKRESFYCSPRPDSASTNASPALSNATETIMQPQTASNEASQNKNNNFNASLGATILASRFAANTRRARLKSVNSDVSTKKFSKLQKPEEPDFSAEPDD